MYPSGPPGQFDWTKLAHCTSACRSCLQLNKTLIRPLRHILRFFLDKAPLWNPRGSGLDQNCTCTTRPWGQQNVTINRSLQYLVTEAREEQDIVYGQTRRTAGRRTKGYRISSTGLRLNNPVSVTRGQTESSYLTYLSIATNLDALRLRSILRTFLQLFNFNHYFPPTSFLQPKSRTKFIIFMVFSSLKLMA